MSGSENGGNGNEPQQHQKPVSPGHTIGARSASPAKRSAADMEDGGQSSQQAPPPGSFLNGQEIGQSDFDQAMEKMTPAAANETMDTQETGSADTSVHDTVTSNTSSATSFQSDALPSYSATDGQRESKYDSSRPPIDEQVKKVYEMTMQSVEVGQRGYLVSIKWLERVMSRSSDGLNNSEFPKEAREGDIGPMDNSDLVPEGAFVEPVLRDMESEPFIPIKAGLVPGQDCQILPKQAYGLVVSWYGNTLGQKPIVRYAHNTADSDATHENIQYELYPPIITVRKFPQPSQQTAHPPRTIPKLAVDELRLKEERRGWGQLSPDDAAQLVSARSERFDKVLLRSKRAAGVPVARKVRIWKLLDPAKASVGSQQTGVLSPPASRSTSPIAARAPTTKLVLDVADFNQMEIGKDMEYIDAKDETNTTDYTSPNTMQTYTLFDECGILLEEMIQGPAGGDYPSDQKKKGGRFGLGKKNDSSKPGSTTASGRTSPAPGMMTRGRTRRDGRTRGTMGLSNLGNTCYMNSALQCIRNVEELAIYFLAQKYKSEINFTNPLGHKGVMAKQYSNVLESIYGDNNSGVVSPTAFKKTLGQLQPLFSGYGQQDSQEFLSFLVDALHEDLNRIQKKPYTENPDSDDKTVHDPQAIIELGETYRTNHRARNDSIAMDLFNGFYKNTMECPVCGKISITFDPYSLLTLQLPIENTFQHNFTFVSLRGKPVNHMIDMDKNSTLRMVKDNIASKHSGVKDDRLWMVEVYNHKIFKVFDDSITLGEAGIQGNDHIFVFELEDVPSNAPQPATKKSSYSLWSSSSKDDAVPAMDDPKADRFAVPVFSRLKNQMMMHPMYILVTREEAKDFDTILKKVLVVMSRLTDRPILTEWDAEKTADDKAAVDKEAETTAVDDNAQLSDRSVPSEDGYVEVSKGESTLDADVQMNGTATPAESQDDSDDRPVPPRFMDRDYFISPPLREHLFAMNYAQGESSGMYCTGMSSIQDRSIRNMFDRVKLPARRASVQSSSSGEESTTSTGSGAQVNGESETSDADENVFDQPDIRLGEPESYLSLPVEGSDDDSLPDNPLGSFAQPALPRKGRGKRNKHGKKGRRNNVKTYGKKGKRGHHQNRPDSSGSLQSTQSHRSLGGKSPQEDDNPYYIKLGEGIVLDWHLEGFDGLFNGNTAEEGEFRGQFISSSDGKGLPIVHDPEVVARRERRAARKTYGITLDDCFNETGKRETLSADNTWYCNRCKEMRQAAKTLEIWTIPDILVVHLKRFGGNRSFRDKIDVLVDYPIEGLDMTERVGLKEDGKEYVYDLFAVDCHFGGLGGGHYTAMAKNFYDGQWYDYNDSTSSKVGEKRLNSAAAYLLFYRRRSDKPLGPQYLQDLVLEARNPTQNESAAEETAEESDSGEGRLGGPIGSLQSSSGLAIGAGVAAATLSRASGGGIGMGAAAQAGSSLTTRTNKFGGDGEPWSFDGLDASAAAAEDAGGLENDVDGNDDDGDDAASTAAEVDGQDDRMEEWGGFEDAPEEFPNTSAWSSAARNSPVEDGNDWAADYQDEHSAYSNAHENQGEEFSALHLEDAGAIGEVPMAELETVEVYPDPPTPGRHDKSD